MPRNRQPVNGDEAVVVDLDSGFMGVNNRLDPALLRSGAAFYDVNKEVMQPGLLADGMNVRFDAGQCRTRPGSLTPVQFNPAFTMLRGAGPFVDEFRQRWILAADANRVWMLADRRTPTWIELTPGLVIQSAVEMIQTPAEVLMFRGRDDSVLTWTGDRLDPWTEIPDPVQDPDRPSFLSPPPRADFAILMSDRLFVPYGDAVAWSDLGDYTAFDLTLNQAPIPHADGGSIVALAAYQGNRLIVFKQKSVHFITGVFGDMSAYMVDSIKVPVGCRARKSVVEVGGDLYFLGDGGVYSLTQTVQGELRSTPVPLSWPIQGWIDRINWLAVGGACASADPANSLYLLDVPMDGSTTNNVRLVYNTATEQWQGMDSVVPPPDAAVREVVPSEAIWSWDPAAGLCAATASDGPPLLTVATQALVTADLFGRRTVFAIEPNRITALGHGTTDFIDGNAYHIYTRLETRGYLFGQLGIKLARSVTLALGTNNPELTISVVTDGVHEARRIWERKTRNRYRYAAHGHADWPGTNAANDFSLPGREDYGLAAGDSVQPQGGIPLNLQQEWPASFPVRRASRWISARIENFRGTLVLKTVQCEALPERRFFKSITT